MFCSFIDITNEGASAGQLFCVLILFPDGERVVLRALRTGIPRWRTRAVQDALVEMSRSGVIQVRATNRERHYSRRWRDLDLRISITGRPDSQTFQELKS